MSELQELLMQQMLSGQQSGSGEMSRMFAEHEDPRIRLIAQFMGPQNAASAADPGQPENVEVIEVEPPRPAITSTSLRRKLRRLVEDLRAAQTTGDTLAAALGACYLCWGEYPRCEHCGGAGRPGWCEPDAELYAEYVAPAVARFHPISLSTGPAEPPHLIMPRTGDGPPNRSQP